MSCSSDSSSLGTDSPPEYETVHTPIDTSSLVNEKWKIESKIGSGGTGVVYEGTDLDSGENVAVKLEHRDEGLVRREKKVYRRLGCFSESIRAFGLPFIHFYGNYGLEHEALVMDCFGPSLETFIQSGEMMDQEASSRIAMQALDILEYVHSQGVLHGDIAGGNLLRGRNDPDALYLVDFGLSSKCRRGESFTKPPMDDLRGLGMVLCQLRTGEVYIGEIFSSGVVPELDRYFEMLESYKLRNAVDYTALRRMFEDFMLEHRISASQS